MNIYDSVETAAGAVRAVAAGFLATLDGTVRHAVSSVHGGLFLLTLAAAPLAEGSHQRIATA